MKTKLAWWALIATSALWSELSQAQPSSLAREDFWVPDGPVNAIVETNGIVYVGGLFDYVGLVTETGNALDLVSAASTLDFPTFKGAIKAVATDNAGGWFVGGLFTAAGGWPVTNLAHILANRTVDTNWTPNPNGPVQTLTLGPAALYVGGTFQKIGGQSRARLAALDPATAAALPFLADCSTTFPGGSVSTLAYADGRLYVGGYFSKINDSEREHLGSVDATTGAVSDWHPNGYTGSQAGSRVDVLVISGNTLYVGGTFTSIGGAQTNGPNRNFIAALDVTKNFGAGVLPWNPSANGPVSSIALSCDTVYIGGGFTSVGGANRNRIAAVDRLTGQATAWDPNADNDVLTLLLAGRIIYAGGKFNEIGGQHREFLAALDTDSGRATLWNPRADTGVSGLAIAQGTMLAGGALGPGGKVRKNLAAFDTRTGRPLDWSPQVSGGTTNNATLNEGVNAIALSNNVLYVGGYFTNINGQLRNRLGAVDRLTGALLAWDPNSAGAVHALAAGGGAVFAGGTFKSVGLLPRTNFVALNPVTGQPTALTANTDTKVASLYYQANRIYLGGTFTKIGSVTRNKLAAVDATSGALLTWNPNVNDLVSSISVQNNSVYFGGQFSTVGGQAISRLGAVDVTTASITCWRPAVQSAGFPGVDAVLALGNVVYAGGTFTTNGGQPRNSLSSLITNCPGNATAWDPNVDRPVTALAASSNMVFAGSSFQSVGGQYHPHFAVFPPPSWPRLTRQPENQITNNGQPVLFAAEATGQAPLSFQWQFSGTNLPGANSSNLLLAATRDSDSGLYELVVTNAVGLVRSRPVTLTV
ncbi:MAG TPA: immunoglobulin domain-containing protein, partial [Verrucomicrobiae bacterium]